jgi:hypothetical protein
VTFSSQTRTPPIASGTAHAVTTAYQSWTGPPNWAWAATASTDPSNTANQVPGQGERQGGDRRAAVAEQGAGEQADGQPGGRRGAGHDEAEAAVHHDGGDQADQRLAGRTSGAVSGWSAAGRACRSPS